MIFLILFNGEQSHRNGRFDSTMDKKIIICTCTTEQTDEIIDHLLKKRLVACANVISSVNARYWWNSRIENAKENLVLMETKAGLVSNVIEEISKIHSYETPKIISIDIEDGFNAYMSWIGSETA